MSEALQFANERLRKASKRLKEANEELHAAEREQRIATEWVEHLENKPGFLTAGDAFSEQGNKP